MEELRKAVMEGMEEVLVEALSIGAERNDEAEVSKEKLKYVEAVTNALIQGNLIRMDPH